MNIGMTDIDRKVYEQELQEWLPARIFDAHVHLFAPSCLLPGDQFAPKNCYHRFGGTFDLTQCLAWTEALLPDQEFHLNSFGHPGRESDLGASAAYTGSVSDNQRFFGMVLLSPKDSAESVIRRMETHRLIGYKPYLSFVDGKPTGEITIDDMLPAPLMEVADQRSLAVTLHIPRAERLADPVNQAQMVELCRRWPNAKIIIAHIGRAYYMSNVIGFLDGLADCPNAYLDTAMVNHEGVLEYAFRHFPSDRILFGSDAPVAFLRGKSVEINNQYAYLMGEDYQIGAWIYDDRGAVAFTYFFYEQLRGIKRAAALAGWGRDQIEGLMFSNAHNVFCGIAKRNYPS